jgi:hypothetical protein
VISEYTESIADLDLPRYFPARKPQPPTPCAVFLPNAPIRLLQKSQIRDAQFCLVVANTVRCSTRSFMAHRKNRTEHTNAQTQGVIAEVRGAEQKFGTTGNRYLLRITTTAMVLHTT